MVPFIISFRLIKSPTSYKNKVYTFQKKGVVLYVKQSTLFYENIRSF